MNARDATCCSLRRSDFGRNGSPWSGTQIARVYPLGSGFPPDAVARRVQAKDVACSSAAPPPVCVVPWLPWKPADRRPGEQGDAGRSANWSWSWPRTAVPGCFRGQRTQRGLSGDTVQPASADCADRCSGGPADARQRTEGVTVEEALAHPTWRMGPKITVDSATLMNKALEVIEARWLFGLSPSQIDVIIHPESIIHSFVEFVDGSVLAQISPPDMRLPIQYALTYPERLPCPARRVNWRELTAFHFEAPDRATFPALDLGYEVAGRGGTTGAVLNAANEMAVEAFLENRLPFPEIARACRPC